MAAGGAERPRLNVALVITVALACSGPPAAEDGAAVASPSAAPRTPPPTETTRSTPIASATHSMTAALSIRLEPPAPQPGAGFVIVISGVRPGEQFELSVARPGEDPSFAPYKADARGEFRSIVPPGALTVFTVVARRADGASAQLAFGTAALGPLTPTPRGTAGTATPSALQPLRTSGALPAPATGAPAERAPSPSLGPTPAPFAVTLERVTDAGEIDIVLGGLRPGELVELTIGLPASPDDVSRVNADAGGAFRWRSPVAPGLAFTVVARRATGEMARAAATAAPPTLIPTAAPDPSCPTGPVDAARTGVDGYVRWGAQALPGLRVEIYEGDIGGALVGTAVTGPDGYFRVVGIARLGQYRVHVPRTAPYEQTGAPGAHLACANAIVRAPNLPSGQADSFTPHGIQMARALTGFSIAYDSVLPAGPVTLTWQAIAQASYYCVDVFDYTAQRDLLQGRCYNFPANRSAVVREATYTTPLLLPGRRYGILVQVILEGLLNPLGFAEVQFTTR